VCQRISFFKENSMITGLLGWPDAERSTCPTRERSLHRHGILVVVTCRQALSAELFKANTHPAEARGKEKIKTGLNFYQWHNSQCIPTLINDSHTCMCGQQHYKWLQSQPHNQLVVPLTTWGSQAVHNSRTFSGTIHKNTKRIFPYV